MFGVMIFYLIITNLLSANNNNNLFINAGSFSNKTKISFLVINPLNQKCGYIPQLGEFKEINECSYGETILGDSEMGPDENDFATLEFANNSEVIFGTYTLIFYGLKNIKYWISLYFDNILKIEFEDYISSGTKKNFNLYLDPTPGAPPPVLTKVVTFQTLRDDIEVAYKLNQLGDEKFKDSLVRMINISEKLYNKCGKIDDKLKDKDKNKDEKIKKTCYKPVIAILRLIVKRLEVVNKLCDNPTSCKQKCKDNRECDEEEAFREFDTKYRKDNNFKEFFEEWDKDEYHKHKKTCKRYVTDEALEIISTDVNWLIKSLGTDIWNDYKTNHNPYIADKYKQFFK